VGCFYRDWGGGEWPGVAPRRGDRGNGGVNGFNAIEGGGEVKRGED
jgi:hypothetical protein